MADNRNLIFENARTIYNTNFEGRESRYNRKGARNFQVVIDDLRLAQSLSTEGWNVKYTNPREDDDESFVPTAYIQVMLRYPAKDQRGKGPRVTMVTGRGITTILDEESVGILDSLEIESVDVELRPYHWSDDDGAGGGVKGYVQTLYAVIKTDPFEHKYVVEE